MTGTEGARPGRSASLPSRAKVRQVSSAASRTACQSGPTCASPATAPVSTSSISGATGVRSGRRSTQRWSGRLYGGAAPTGRASTALSAPRRSRSARIRRPERRDAAAGGMSSTAVPPSASRANACCTQASSDSLRAGKPYSRRAS